MDTIFRKFEKKIDDQGILRNSFIFEEKNVIMTFLVFQNYRFAIYVYWITQNNIPLF